MGKAKGDSRQAAQTHRLIAPWKGDDRFPAMAQQAAALARSGRSEAEIVAAITAEFGPPAGIARLREQPLSFRIYGDVGVDIDSAAVEQMATAMRLPIAERGVLMPDGQPGYALPIGGVFAAHRAVSPFMVGVDIGCRMHLSIVDVAPEEFLRWRTPLFADLEASTVFGVGSVRQRKASHAILDDPRWQATHQTRSLHGKAADQLGTSGGGNHFAELVVGEVVDPAAAEAARLDLPARFGGLLTHSGSRGVGYALAEFYAKVAEKETARLASVPRHYAWLDVDSTAGQDYWLSMELAGAFARANHEVIHATFLRRAGLKAAATVQNHHNFAWRIGDTVIHRKGATPAEAGVVGVIPGSMGTASYLVVGCGSEEALHSASHGAGRHSSRKAAKESIARKDVERFLAERDIIVRGLSVDESPQAYKDIERVLDLQVQAGLIRPVARMRPIAVIMAGGPGED